MSKWIKDDIHVESYKLRANGKTYNDVRFHFGGGKAVAVEHIQADSEEIAYRIALGLLHKAIEL